jgi:hypothetical protein
MAELPRRLATTARREDLMVAQILGPPFRPAREQVATCTADAKLREKRRLAGCPKMLDVVAEVEVYEGLWNRC